MTETRRELPCHVWLVEQVTTSVRDPEPGVLVEWRRGPKGWEGLVLHGWHGGARLRWVLAAELRPG